MLELASLDLPFLETQFVGRPLLLWIVGGGVFTLVILVLPVVRGIVLAIMRKRQPSEASVQGFVLSLVAKWYFVSTAALAVGLGAVPLEPSVTVSRWLRTVLVIVAAVQLIAWVYRVIHWVGARYIERQQGDAQVPDPALVGAVRTFGWMAQAVALACVVLLALQNLGVDVTALVTGLGVGGIAVALAVQNVLGDLFASLSITLDKPFVPGDFIVMGSEMGTVEKIGLKTTRLRSLSGEQLVLSNNDLLSSRVRNYKRMNERRVVFAFGVLYSTPPEVLEKIPGMVREIIAAEKLARFDRCHFYRFGDSSLDFETVYYALSPEFTVHMDVLQRVHLAILRRLTTLGVGIAFPTRTLHVASLPAAAAPPGSAR